MRTFGNDELRRRVDEVLYYVWDPIGVREEPFARYEYENYVPHVLQLLENHDDPEPISECLAGIVRTSMEFSPDKNRCDETAKLLLLHKQAIKQGCA
jgi:hypothetical protein